MEMNELTGGDISACASNSPFALQVLGDSMEPEFMDGAIIIVDPAVPLHHGAYIVIDYKGETTFRQFIVRDEKHYLVALNKAYEEMLITEEYRIRGIVSQQARSRKLGIKKSIHYLK
ncbi:MAG TPA: S24 family peptidase [Gammaproteobacteria bacterium]|nr:S24 family peptidase [Gammaproteobacteria bacterium]